MPPRSSPHKLRVPILRKHTWCMIWPEGDSAALHPIVVQCYAETYDGKNWKHCNHLHKPCESVPEGIAANRYELLDCLSWAEQVTEDVIPESTRLILGSLELTPEHILAFPKDVGTAHTTRMEKRQGKQHSGWAMRQRKLNKEAKQSNYSNLTCLSFERLDLDFLQL
ncbi:hypothetical protein PENPOL_c002G09549 [Penicillium polonicum]|uniref:Uncharacterized protein n=1 Tax=Penicillium polonicum TaxID=60169 RepID=A0A1V6NWN5_PENPO|nr:hypothetical protein PENPOL_c002G09549 [Penicillium polonicum]